MALTETHFYKFIFDDQHEYIIGHEKEKISSVISDVSSGLVASDYIKLQYKDAEPIYIKKNRLFSIQKQAKETIGTQTRVWTLA